ncbi:hypothetical protein CDD83_5114 [Cordyceps sp. RAO-2017]|nr:hypothetical protein CDD83_5114 [Cordyceps sp. RAO-2017]
MMTTTMLNRSSTRLLRGRSAQPKPQRATTARRGVADARRPSMAPKPIIDIKHIRQNAELYERTCEERRYRRLAGHPSRIVALHKRWQELQRQGRSLRERSNLLRKLMANPATSSGDEELGEVRQMTRAQVQEEARRLKAELAGIERGEAEAVAEMETLALELPNLTSDETPRGDEPVVLGYINQPPPPDDGPDAARDHDANNERQEGADADVKPWRSHVQIGTELGILDFAAAAASSGWGWYYLVGEAAQLEQALVQYALGAAAARGWTPVSPPSMVYSHIGAACGFRPRDQHGEQQVYAVARARADAERGVPELCLAGTSEIALAGMAANATLDAADLPLRRVAVSRCYRAEAGARGADAKGLFRVHEFTKVELFAWTAPDAARARALFDDMLALQADILAALGLRCRLLSMPAADLGASAARKVDIEAYFPSRRRLLPASRGWGEVTSASLCTDYQARRLATRTRLTSGALAFPYSANATALAVPRVLAALLESGWDEASGTVAVPACLRPWMGGRDRIRGTRRPLREGRQAVCMNGRGTIGAGEEGS